MAHHSHEGHGRRCERVHLHPLDLGLREQQAPQLLPDGERLLPRRARRQIDEDLELRLVVEGEHLHPDEAHPTSATAPANSARVSARNWRRARPEFRSLR